MRSFFNRLFLLLLITLIGNIVINFCIPLEVWPSGGMNIVYFISNFLMILNGPSAVIIIIGNIELDLMAYTLLLAQTLLIISLVFSCRKTLPIKKFLMVCVLNTVFGSLILYSFIDTYVSNFTLESERQATFVP